MDSKEEVTKPNHMDWKVYMITLRCAKEPIRIDHIDRQLNMTILKCEKASIGSYHRD